MPRQLRVENLDVIVECRLGRYDLNGPLQDLFLAHEGLTHNPYRGEQDNKHQDRQKSVRACCVQALREDSTRVTMHGKWLILRVATQEPKLQQRENEHYDTERKRHRAGVTHVIVTKGVAIDMQDDGI